MRALLAVLLILCTGLALAQNTRGRGRMVPGPNPVPPFGSMVPNTGGMTTNPQPPSSGTPCAVFGQLDFSDATGCNLVLAGH